MNLGGRGFIGNAPTTSRQGTLPFYKNHGQLHLASAALHMERSGS
jgi:hypothetical protein